MSTDEGDFLRRWSRRKKEAAVAKPVEKAVEKAPELPPVDSLTFDSDFSAYLRANVDESLKRAALKKLLHDPRFNIMDGLDTYIDDYSKDDPIPEEMLKKLEHARGILFPEEKQEEKEKTEEAKKEDSEGEDGHPRQDA
jgi:hypothetical protein